MPWLAAVWLQSMPLGPKDRGLFFTEYAQEVQTKIGSELEIAGKWQVFYFMPSDLYCLHQPWFGGALSSKRSEGPGLCYATWRNQGISVGLSSAGSKSSHKPGSCRDPTGQERHRVSSVVSPRQDSPTAGLTRPTAPGDKDALDLPPPSDHLQEQSRKGGLLHAA